MQEQASSVDIDDENKQNDSQKLFNYYKKSFDIIFAIQLFELYQIMFEEEPEIFSLTVDYVNEILEQENDGITPLAAVFMLHGLVTPHEKISALLSPERQKIIDEIIAKANPKTLNGHLESILGRYKYLKTIFELSKNLIDADSIKGVSDLSDVFAHMRTSGEEDLQNKGLIPRTR
jgi:hypothetical protein